MISETLDRDQLRYLGKAVTIFHPEILEKLKPKIKKPVPTLLHFILLPVLFTRFCQLKEIDEQSIVGPGRGSAACEFKRQFIGVMLYLYDPLLLTGIHSDKIRNRLAFEISAVLKIEREWVSEQAADLKKILNIYNNKPAFQSIRNEVKEIAEILEKDFKEQ